MAHPLQAVGIVPELVKVGLQGVETHYPGYSAEEVRYLEGIAQRYGLVATGGSDYHGPDVLPIELAAATAPSERVSELRRRRPETARL